MIIKKTKDGSDTLFIPELNEHYHSINGAVTESLHVFVHAGLSEIVSRGKKHVNLLEVGFGTGLNVLLSAKEASKSGCIVHYTGLELHPLPQAVIAQLDFSLTPPENELFHSLHTCGWGNIFNQISPSFFLKKLQVDFTSFTEYEETFDLIYFDAFSPDIHPEMWTQAVFDRLIDSMNPAGILTTYCAKGQVRRNMQQAGFFVERLPGPLGKREMLRGMRMTNYSA